MQTKVSQADSHNIRYPLYQCGVGCVELCEDVARVAEHGGDDGPLGRQPPDDVARDEDGGDDQEEVDDREGGRAHTRYLKMSGAVTTGWGGHLFRRFCTVLVLRMAHRKWKETKQLPSMLPGPAVLVSCLVSFHIRWAILATSMVICFLKVPLACLGSMAAAV